MKITKIILLFFLLMNSLLFSQVSRYEEVSVLGEKVYFPKQTSKYLSELLKDKDIESYYEIAKVYIGVGKIEAAKNFLMEYEKKSHNYIKISQLYDLMGDYKTEINYIEKYLENPDKKTEKIKYYNYIKTLISEKNLDIDPKKYELTKLDILSLHSGDEFEYYEYFLANNWNEDEKKEILKELKNMDKKNSYIERIINKIAKPKELSKIYYDRISDINDTEAYYRYFSVEEQNSKITSFRNDFEKLYYLNYKNDLTADFFKEKLAFKYAKKNEVEKLYELYLIKPDFKLMYNLALENDKIFYEFILKQQDKGISSEIIQKLIEVFYEKFPNSQYGKQVLKIKLQYTEKSEEKLVLVDNAIQNLTLNQNKIDDDLILLKLNILKDMDRKSDEETLLTKIIFKDSYERDELIKFYIQLLEKSGRIEELLNNLKLLNNKTYYIEKSAEYDYTIDKKYKNNLIDYYFEKGEYQKLVNYKDELIYEMYDTLLKNGWNEFLKAALKKYPLQKDWVNLGEFKYFFLNKNYTYLDQRIVSEIFEKDKKTDAELYYLAKHYEKIGENEKSLEIMEKLNKNYILN